MEPMPPTDILLADADTPVAQLQLDWQPQPGAHLQVAGETYRVLERRHRYRFFDGRYQLHRVALYVQKSFSSEVPRPWQGQWVIGDPSCAYNARSELLRCAVRPSGPCHGCPHWQPLPPEL